MSVICSTSFPISRNRYRHIRRVHLQTVDKETNLHKKETYFANRSTAMQHPFTCIVHGCTQSSKIVWVKNFLEDVKTTISRSPEIIIWCYGQWQPIYQPTWI